MGSTSRSRWLARSKARSDDIDAASYDDVLPGDVAITLYWLTSTGASAARSYWESGRAQASAAGQAPPEVSLPVGFTTFPGEIFRAPRSWVEKSYPTLTYFHEADKGGHFAAWEEPDLFASELREAFRSRR
jgi:pimeloyl-ACP methyl ester carboxylesterase